MFIIIIIIIVIIIINIIIIISGKIVAVSHYYGIKTPYHTVI